jgi:hypothetical protein
VKEGRSSNEANLSLGIEHLQIAPHYAGRGRKGHFDEQNLDTPRLVESEFRKAYESIHRLGPSFWYANSARPRSRVGEIRQLLTHDHAGVDAEEVGKLAIQEAGPLLRRLAKSRVPRVTEHGQEWRERLIR